YPATLATTADHDDRVVPSHSFKFVATLQSAQSCDKPILIRVETLGSHGYRPTDKRIAELADQWSFTLAEMQVNSSQPPAPGFQLPASSSKERQANRRKREAGSW